MRNTLIANKKTFSVVVNIFFLLCLSPLVIFSYKHPSNNWDMLGYIAIVMRIDGVKDVKEIHQVTYTSVKKNIPEKDYKQLVDSSGVRAKFASDPLLFEKILPIHVVKPLYILFVYFAYKAGFDLPAATVMPSLIAYSLIGLLLFHWLKKLMRKAIAFFAALLIMSSGFMISSARLSSPDMLSAFFLLATFYFILERPNIRWSLLFLILSIFTRADNILTAFSVFTLLFIADQSKIKMSKNQYLLVLLVLATVYFITIFPIRQFGWSLFYYSEYSKYMDFNRNFDKAYALSDYFSYMYSKVIAGLISGHFTLFVLLALLIILNRFPIKFRQLSLDQLFSLLLVFIMAIRFLLLPDLSDRFNIAYYLCLLIILSKKTVKNAFVHL